MADIGVGLIGFGLAGRSFHAPVIRSVPGLQLAAILQRSGSEAAAQYPDVPIVRSVEALLAMDEVRLVVIATPNETHAPLARQCLDAGRNVVVDKPFTTNYDEADALVQFARKCGRLLTVYQNRRFDGDFQALQQVVAAGRLGRTVRFESNYDRYRPQRKPNAWREKSGPGTGVFFDLAPHLIDHALVLFGLPEAVTADIRIERDDAAVDDAFDLILQYPRGLRATLRATMLGAVLRPRFLLHGTQGAYLKNSFDLQEPALRAGRIPWEQPPTEEEREENSGVLTLTNPDGTMSEELVPPGSADYRSFYANVRGAMLGRGELAVTTQQALDLMRILDLARESSARRCTLPLRERDSQAASSTAL
jgi:predicted dehydrogenase